MVFKWKQCAYINADPNIAGQICTELEESVGLTPKNLLDVSRPEDAPLHKEFEWDDSVAAERFREEQARHIINCLMIEAEVETAEPVMVKAYLNIDHGKKSYESTLSIMSDEEKTQKALDTALAELIAVKKKWGYLTTLKKVFEEVDKVNEQRTN